MKKGIFLIVICIAIVAIPGLLRLQEGQIQEEQPDGTWKCVNQQIRDIVNYEGDVTLSIVEPNDFYYASEWEVHGYLSGDYPPTYFEIKKPIRIPVAYNEDGEVICTLPLPAGTRIYFDVNDPNL